MLLKGAVNMFEVRYVGTFLTRVKKKKLECNKQKIGYGGFSP